MCLHSPPQLQSAKIRKSLTLVKGENLLVLGNDDQDANAISKSPIPGK